MPDFIMNIAPWLGAKLLTMVTGHGGFWDYAIAVLIGLSFMPSELPGWKILGHNIKVGVTDAAKRVVAAWCSMIEIVKAAWADHKLSRVELYSIIDAVCAVIDTIVPLVRTALRAIVDVAFCAFPMYYKLMGLIGKHPEQILIVEPTKKT